MINVDLTQVSTRDLSAELSRRDGVRKIEVLPHMDYVVVIDGEVVADDSGPATVIINVD